MSGRRSRKQDILEALARELERTRGERITTARLAAAAGVSEAALYRHFRGKAEMFAALLSFAEESVYSRVNLILREERSTVARCAKVAYLVLAFSERNPGITRLLLADSSVPAQASKMAENPLPDGRFFARLETQWRQVLREAALRDDAQLQVSSEDAANFILLWVEGRMHQYLRTKWERRPTSGWEEGWRLVERAIFVPEGSDTRAPGVI